MELTFLRHGIAIDREDPECPPDFERYLTPKGIKRMKMIAAWLKARHISYDHIFSSPYVRALQTAEIVAETLGLQAQLEVREQLGCGARLTDMQNVLESAKPDGHYLLVGHEPDLGSAVGQLIGADYIAMKKGGLACIRTDHMRANAGELLFLVPPRLIVTKK